MHVLISGQHRARRTAFVLVALITLLFGTFNFVGVRPARAATLVVTTGADSGPGSLRDLVAAAAPGDIIDFSPSVTTVTLTTGQILVNTSVLIGPLDGSRVVTVQQTTANARVFEFGISGSTVPIVVRRLVITGGNITTIGNSNFTGGGIIVGSSSVQLDHVRIENNSNVNDGGGIRVRTAGALTLLNSTVANNTTTSTTNGGGGIYLTSGTLTLVNTTVSGNVASNAGGGSPAGGGLLAGTNAVVRVHNSTIAFNSAVTGAGNLQDAGATTFNVFNTIISNGSGPAPDVQGDNDTPTGTHNLIGSTTNTSPGNPLLLPANNNLLNATANLAPLNLNAPAVLVRTHALRGSGTPSQAREGGNPAGCIDHVGTPVTLDARDLSRSAAGTGTRCDIGAYEVQLPDITTLTLPNGVVGNGYNQTITRTGGVAAFSWAVTSGSLPTGLNLGSGTGAITGTPTVANTFNFTVTVTDSLGWTDSQALTIVIQNPTPTNTPTFTPSNTATNTPTNTLTPSNTPTNTPTFTLTPSNTPTNTPTATFTPSNTPTATLTPSNTPTFTLTPSNTPTNTPTATFTPSNTPTNTLTFTPTNTPIPPRVDTVGMFNSGTFYLRNSNTTGPADITVTFGNTTDLPVVGDWNGDGVDTIGVYNSTLGTFNLRDSNSPGAPTFTYNFTLGNPGDQPIAGKWDNTMTSDGTGVHRPSNGIIYLRRTLTTGPSDYYIVMGNPGDIAVAGDWNGDGFDSTGVFRPSEGHFFLTNVNGNGITLSDVDFFYGASGDLPFAGDWTGNGISKPGLARNGVVLLRNSLTTGGADSAFAYGDSGWKPLAGKWVAPGRPGAGIIQPVTGAGGGSNAGGDGDYAD
jgi:hypothetical protein